MKSFSFRYGETKLYFGPNVISKLKEHLDGMESVTIVTGRKSAEKSGALQDVKKILEESGIDYQVFSKVIPNPTVDIADDVAEFARKNCSDCLIGIGGGSIIDVSKVSSIIAVNGGRAEDYLNGMKIKRKIKLIAVNLTHGTGSEIDRFAVLTKGKEKVGISARYPDVSFDDPRYMLSLPREQSIYTSIDAFFHSYEAITARAANPLVKTLSMESARIIGENLGEDSQNLEKKYNLLYASMLAGIALDISPAHIVHAIEHALSGIKQDLAHGCGLAMVGARSIYWIHKHSKESADILERLTGKKVKSPSDAEKTFRDFLDKVGFDERLSDYGFGRDDFSEIKEMVFGRLSYSISRANFKLTEDMLIDILEKSL